MSDGPDAFGNPPSQPAAAAAPGWYPDPMGGSAPRWWDGQRWHGVGDPSGATASGGQTDGFAIAALVLSVLGGIVLSVIFALVALSRIRKGRRQRGRGMAIAALWISGAWALLIAGIVVLGVTGALDDPNADHYQGVKRQVAVVIDDFEQAADDNDAAAVCALMTPGLQAKLATLSGTCTSAIGDEEGVQAHLDARSITLTAPGRASAVVREDDHTLTMTFVRGPSGWKVDEITKRP